MQRNYSLAEAKRSLHVIVEELNADDSVQLTERGQPVAVLLSMEAYHRWTASKPDFWEAYEAFRAEVPLPEVDIDPAHFDVRDPSPGREVTFCD